MPIHKQHLEFHAVDMAQGWEVPPGYPPGIQQKILTGSIDEQRGTGFRTRLLRFQPGVYTTAPFVHEHWEEVYLLSGDLIVGNDAQGQGGEKFLPNTYACRPPGTLHGPFKSDTGCLLLEQHYYDESARPAQSRAASAKPAKRVAKATRRPATRKARPAAKGAKRAARRHR